MGKGPFVELDAHRVRIGSEDFVVLSMPAARIDVSGLSRAEFAVAERLLRGHSNARIARARKTSARTVANQVASIFRKLGVRSRRELLARLA